MDFALAKALKDAGFFQEGNGTRIAPPDKIVVRRDDFAYVPTLEELIEALPKGHFRLTRYRDNCVAECGHHPTYENAAGDTPTIAVALLWLVLNEKGGRE